MTFGIGATVLAAATLGLYVPIFAAPLVGRGWRLTNRLLRARSEIDDLRTRDTLTGLMTRSAIEASLDSAVQACDSGGRTLALLYVGLDNFRPVNEGFGPRVGDAVLVEVGRRLLACQDQRLLASRVGGDEFVMLVEADTASAGAAADQVLQTLQRPFCFTSHPAFTQSTVANRTIFSNRRPPDSYSPAS